MKVFLIVFSAIFIGFFSVYFLGDDNVIEEICEQVIKEEVGITIDLTPKSKEILNENR